MIGCHDDRLIGDMLLTPHRDGGEKEVHRQLTPDAGGEVGGTPPPAERRPQHREDRRQDRGEDKEGDKDEPVVDRPEDLE